MDFQGALAHLLGLIGTPVRVEISAVASGSIRASAGFIGVLERGVPDAVSAVAGSENAINFRVVPDGIPDELAGWFLIPSDSFETAVVVAGPLGQTLTVRAEGVDITIKSAPEAGSTGSSRHSMTPA